MPQGHVHFRPSASGFTQLRALLDRRAARLIASLAAAIPLMIGALAITASPASAASAPGYVSFHGAIATAAQ
jgi:hypothetical protein